MARENVVNLDGMPESFDPDQCDWWDGVWVFPRDRDVPLRRECLFRKHSGRFVRMRWGTLFERATGSRGKPDPSGNERIPVQKHSGLVTYEEITSSEAAGWLINNGHGSPLRDLDDGTAEFPSPDEPLGHADRIDRFRSEFTSISEECEDLFEGWKAGVTDDSEFTLIEAVMRAVGAYRVEFHTHSGPNERGESGEESTRAGRPRDGGGDARECREDRTVSEVFRRLDGKLNTFKPDSCEVWDGTWVLANDPRVPIRRECLFRTKTGCFILIRWNAAFPPEEHEDGRPYIINPDVDYTPGLPPDLETECVQIGADDAGLWLAMTGLQPPFPDIDDPTEATTYPTPDSAITYRHLCDRVEGEYRSIDGSLDMLGQLTMDAKEGRNIRKALDRIPMPYRRELVSDGGFPRNYHGQYPDDGPEPLGGDFSPNDRPDGFPKGTIDMGLGNRIDQFLQESASAESPRVAIEPEANPDELTPEQKGVIDGKYRNHVGVILEFVAGQDKPPSQKHVTATLRCDGRGPSTIRSTLGALTKCGLMTSDKRIGYSVTPDGRVAMRLISEKRPVDTGG